MVAWRSWLVVGAVAVLAGSGCSIGKASTGAAGNGGQCVANADCPLGKFCVSGVCEMPGTAMVGEKCAASRDCGAGLYCGPTGQCAMGGTHGDGEACSADATCKPPLRCNLDGFFGSCGAPGNTEPGQACAATKDCLAGLWCGASKTCLPLGQAFPPFAGVACSDEGKFRAYFQVPRPGAPPPDFFRLPFPNDARVSNGKLDLSDFPRPGPTPLGVDLVSLYVDSWVADFDGFSAIAPVTFRFSGELDFATASGSTILLIDVTAGDTFGQELGRSWWFSGSGNKFICKNRFSVGNLEDSPLRPRHTYAVILTTGLKSTGGEAAAIDGDLAALLGAAAPADATLARAWSSYQPLRDWLISKAAAAPPVAAAAVFTVQDGPGHFQRVATSVAAQPVPELTALTLCDGKTQSPCDDGTPARACPAAPSAAFDEIHGKLRVPLYQKGTPPYDTPDQGGGIPEAADGSVTPTGTSDICFALTVPHGTMPAAGWPLLVHHHGTGGSMRSFISDGLAGAAARAGRPGAALGFDAVEHGARRGGSTKKPDDLVFNPLNPRAARDNVLQGAADILQALRVAGVSVAAAASPTRGDIKFDATAVTFFGHSQGSTSGALAVAASDAAPAVVFSGAGAHLTQSLLHKQNPINVGAGLSFLLGEPLDGAHPVMILFQNFFDRSDPLIYNPLIVTRPPTGLASKHVFMSWGTDDTYTPQETLTANALSLGVPPVGPVLQTIGTPPIARPVSANMDGGDGKKRTAALFQYAPATGADAYDGHFVALKNAGAVSDWSAFLSSYLVTGTPTVP